MILLLQVPLLLIQIMTIEMVIVLKRLVDQKTFSDVGTSVFTQILAGLK